MLVSLGYVSVTKDTLDNISMCESTTLPAHWIVDQWQSVLHLNFTFDLSSFLSNISFKLPFLYVTNIYHRVAGVLEAKT